MANNDWKQRQIENEQLAAARAQKAAANQQRRMLENEEHQQRIAEIDEERDARRQELTEELSQFLAKGEDERQLKIYAFSSPSQTIKLSGFTIDRDFVNWIKEDPKLFSEESIFFTGGSGSMDQEVGPIRGWNSVSKKFETLLNDERLFVFDENRINLGIVLKVGEIRKALNEQKDSSEFYLRVASDNWIEFVAREEAEKAMANFTFEGKEVALENAVLSHFVLSKDDLEVKELVKNLEICMTAKREYAKEISALLNSLPGRYKKYLLGFLAGMIVPPVLIIGLSRGSFEGVVMGFVWAAVAFGAFKLTALVDRLLMSRKTKSIAREFCR